MRVEVEHVYRLEEVAVWNVSLQLGSSACDACDVNLSHVLCMFFCCCQVCDFPLVLLYMIIVVTVDAF